MREFVAFFYKTCYAIFIVRLVEEVIILCQVLWGLLFNPTTTPHRVGLGNE